MLCYFSECCNSFTSRWLHHPHTTPNMNGGPHLSLVSGSIGTNLTVHRRSPIYHPGNAPLRRDRPARSPKREPNMNVLPPPSKEVMQAVYSSLAVDEDRIKEAVKMLREWLQMQPHLPHVMDDKRLENIFLRNKTSLEKAKSTIDMYYTLRTAVPELFTQRDPEKPWFKNTADAIYFMSMPNLTEDNHRVIVNGILDSEVKNDIFQDIKLSFMCFEIILSEDCSAGLVLIYDAKNITLSFVAQMTPTLIHKVVLCTLKGFKCRIKAFHFLNVPSYAIHLMNIFKSLLKSKLASRIHIHPQGYESLHNHVSTKILPKEMGGDAESITEVWDAWKQKHLSYRDWYLKEDCYNADESRRPGKTLTSRDLFGIEGSFRQLSVD